MAFSERCPRSPVVVDSVALICRHNMGVYSLQFPSRSKSPIRDIQRLDKMHKILTCGDFSPILETWRKPPWCMRCAQCKPLSGLCTCRTSIFKTKITSWMLRHGLDTYGIHPPIWVHGLHESLPICNSSNTNYHSKCQIERCQVNSNKHTDHSPLLDLPISFM